MCGGSCAHLRFKVLKADSTQESPWCLLTHSFSLPSLEALIGQVQGGTWVEPYLLWGQGPITRFVKGWECERERNNIDWIAWWHFSSIIWIFSLLFSRPCRPAPQTTKSQHCTPHIPGYQVQFSFPREQLELWISSGKLYPNLIKLKWKLFFIVVLNKSIA